MESLEIVLELERFEIDGVEIGRTRKEDESIVMVIVVCVAIELGFDEKRVGDEREPRL